MRACISTVSGVGVTRGGGDDEGELWYRGGDGVLLNVLGIGRHEAFLELGLNNRHLDLGCGTSSILCSFLYLSSISKQLSKFFSGFHVLLLVA